MWTMVCDLTLAVSAGARVAKLPQLFEPPAVALHDLVHLHERPTY